MSVSAYDEIPDAIEAEVEFAYDCENEAAEEELLLKQYDVLQYYHVETLLFENRGILLLPAPNSSSYATKKCSVQDLHPSG